jgi:hypothetical protein
MKTYLKIICLGSLRTVVLKLIEIGKVTKCFLKINYHNSTDLNCYAMVGPVIPTARNVPPPNSLYRSISVCILLPYRTFALRWACAAVVTYAICGVAMSLEICTAIEMSND